MRKRLLLLALVSLLVTGAILAAQALAATKKVTLGDNFFSKTSLTIHKGTKVTWRWSGTHNSHNVTSKGHFHSRTQSSGSFSKTFKTKGTFTVICTVHPTQMRMKVVVK
jgi:plastocyanin